MEMCSIFLIEYKIIYPAASSEVLIAPKNEHDHYQCRPLKLIGSDKEPQTLNTIVANLGVTMQRIRQIEVNQLEKLINKNRGSEQF
jgi:hypothetical protein